MLIRFLVTFPCWGFIIITLDSKTKKRRGEKAESLDLSSKQPISYRVHEIEENIPAKSK